jgi:hypothetical protein
MKKNFTPLLFGIIILTTHVQAQTCESLPIEFVSGSMRFEATDVESYGDSMISFELVNRHATDFFAYPQAKLIPTTPLPAGMELATVNLDWMVFASAWNIDTTVSVHIYYDVATAIPANYTVTFRLWLNNLIPVTDSCYFDELYTVNLNPVANAITDLSAIPTFTIYPNPSQAGVVAVELMHNNKGNFEATIVDLTGRVISQTISSGLISTENLSSGIYYLHLQQNGVHLGTSTLLIQ